MLLLDEPTNHLDVEAVAWLAAHLRGRDQALVVVTHDRQPHPPLARLPVDVEEAGVAGVAAAGEEVPPPGVGGGHLDPHVVGHHVDQQPHPPLVDDARQPLERLPRAAGGVDAGGVDLIER